MYKRSVTIAVGRSFLCCSINFKEPLGFPAFNSFYRSSVNEVQHLIDLQRVETFNKMPKFDSWISHEITRDSRNRNIFRRMLNHEWTIICVLNSVDRPYIVNSIEIHRENTSEEFKISGIITKTNIFQQHDLKKQFSRIIKKGSSFITLVSNFNQNVSVTSQLDIKGRISNIIDEQPKNIENVETKDIIRMNSLEQLLKDLENAMDRKSSCLADITLICGSTCIPAHKFILCARSPVFAAMFAHPTEERLKNEVDITDIDASVIQDMLKYMYTGKTANLTATLAADLLFAADKYHLQDLKKVCSNYLMNNVCLENVWKILVLGDMHDQNLKYFAIDYICNKCGEFSVLQDSQDWKTMRKERPNLVIDLLEYMVKYRDEKLK